MPSSYTATWNVSGSSSKAVFPWHHQQQASSASFFYSGPANPSFTNYIFPDGGLNCFSAKTHATINLVAAIEHCEKEVLNQGIAPHSPQRFRGQLVQRCLQASTLSEAKRIHEDIITYRIIPDVFVENTIINMYVRCGSIADARHAFETMYGRNVYSWTLMLAGYEKYGQLEEAVNIFWQMEKEGVNADSVTFVSVIKACTRAAIIEEGKEVHSYMIKCGHEINEFMFNALVDMYSKCDSPVDAMYVFEQTDKKSVVSWNSVIAGCVQSGDHALALTLFDKMKDEGFEPDEVTLVCVLKSCGSLASVNECEHIHVHILESGFESNPFIGSTLVDFYSKSGQMDIACQVFNRMPYRDVVAWNAIIAGYANDDQNENAIGALKGLIEEDVLLNEITFMNISNACIEPSFLEDGRYVHVQAIALGQESDVAVGNSLIDIYGKCHSLEDAVLVFQKLPVRDTVSWNSLMAGYIEGGLNDEAIKLFHSVGEDHKEPNEATFVIGLHACSLLADLEEGMTIHAQAVSAGQELSLRVGNTLMDLYCKCGHLDDALHLLNTCPGRDVVSWNGLITGYVQHGHGESALEILQKMQQDGLYPNEVSFLNALTACAGMKAVDHGMAIHSDIIKAGYEADVSVGTSLVDMYVKCARMPDARNVFDKMSEEVTAAWNTIIAGYGDNEDEAEALRLFYSMQAEGVTIDDFTFVSVLNAGARICALEEGMCIYAQYVKTGCNMNLFVGSAMVDMYAKCGQVEDARHVFEELQDHDLFLWTVMIGAYAQQGYDQEVFELWEKMKERGVKPDGTIYISVLSACTHLGFVEKGVELLSSMTLDYGISPTSDHFACFVDLLGRAGCIHEAEHFIRKLPVQPEASVWRTLLGACKSSGEVEVAEVASIHLRDIKPEDPTAYVFLSNTYARSGRT